MATIDDVAKRAGVSPVTVSRVLNNVGNVSPATEAKVQQAIAEMGYVPSGVARSLRSRQTRTLALLVPDITNAFWTTVARGVEDAAQSQGYSVFLCNTDENAAKQRRYLEAVVTQRVDGVIIAPYASDPETLSLLRTRNIPTVVVDRHIDDWDVDTVSGDSIAGARALTKHLIELGHRKIAALMGPDNTSTSTDRVAGYQIALAEEGIPVDPQLIVFGEFRIHSGELMAEQILDSGANPTAIFAGNNNIAMGVIDALANRGLRIPGDMALVSFDDLPNTSRLFPFLTVAVQPVYEIGTNAAQLLLSRLEAEANLQPRRVVLPTRLIIRHSCGSKLNDEHEVGLSLPLTTAPDSESVFVPRVKPEELNLSLDGLGHLSFSSSSRGQRPSPHHRSDVNRLMTALQHREADRLPHLEFWITSQAVYEYVLERKLDYQIVNRTIGDQGATPEDQVELAQRLGMDAVVCDFAWRPNNVFATASDGSRHYVDGTVKSLADLDDLETPSSMAAQLNNLERYLRAIHGTGVGVVASFTSFFDSALLAVGMNDALYMFYDNRAFLEKLMDRLLDHQSRIMRAVCDRFADDLAFFLVRDDIAHNSGLLIHPDMFQDIFAPRMKRLILPVKELGKKVAFHTVGKIDLALPGLYDIGIDIIHPITPESNDIFALKQEWAGKIAMVGNIPVALLAYGKKETIDEKVREYCMKLAPGGGYVLGSSNSIMQGIPPENFLAMIEAVHRYGRYDRPGDGTAAVTQESPLERQTF
ncbi:MAG: substrate-binding domain-containing protein [Chloroflexota bacterium]|nr:substrate-binding domain-containing protein [Chloroflexota bacterium]